MRLGPTAPIRPRLPGLARCRRACQGQAGAAGFVDGQIRQVNADAASTGPKRSGGVRMTSVSAAPDRHETVANPWFIRARFHRFLTHAPSPEHRPRDQLCLLGQHPRRARGDPVGREPDRAARLIRMARDYDREVAAGRDFWAVMVERYGLSLDVVAGSLDEVPPEGPLVVIANHPYGILDGLMLGHILSEHPRRLPHPRPPGVPQGGRARPGDPAGQLRRDPSRRRPRTSRRAGSRSTTWRGGGAIGVFPGGAVATAPRPFRPADGPPAGDASPRG